MFEKTTWAESGRFISNGAWIHPDRIRDSYEVIFVTKGTIYITEQEREYVLKKGDVLILEPNLRHFGHRVSEEQVEFFWLHWYGDVAVNRENKNRKPENSYNISLLFRQLLTADATKRLPETRDYLTRLILVELFSDSIRLDVNHVAERVAAWIRANSYAAITESQLSQRFGYNADYLNRMFKRNFAKTLKQYTDEKRMEYIKNLLLTQTLSLKEISQMTGFSEYKYFLKFFTYHEGNTPTGFRRQYAKAYINTR